MLPLMTIIVRYILYFGYIQTHGESVAFLYLQKNENKRSIKIKIICAYISKNEYPITKADALSKSPAEKSLRWSVHVTVRDGILNF